MKDLFDIYVEKVKELGEQYKIASEVDKHIDRLVELSEKYGVPVDDLVCKWFDGIFNKGELAYVSYLNLRKELEAQYPDITQQNDIFTTDELLALTTTFYQLDRERAEKRAKREKQQAAKEKAEGKGKGKAKPKPQKAEVPYIVTCLLW